jgi:hypothetical protein
MALSRQQLIENIRLDIAYYQQHPHLAVHLFGNDLATLQNELWKITSFEDYEMSEELRNYFGYCDDMEEEQVYFGLVTRSGVRLTSAQGVRRFRK